MSTGGATSTNEGPPDASGAVPHGSSQASTSRRPDPAALERVALRWHGAASEGREPWLHDEVARRMAERLSLFAMQPRQIVQWWPSAAGHAALRQAYPAATITVAAARRVDDSSLPSASRPWWKRWPIVRSADASRPRVVAESDVPVAQAELLWAGMVLHAAADAPTLFERWHAALAVESPLMFSTIGPDTLLELRALYRDLGWGPPAAEPTDMHDLGDALVHAGFADPVMDQERLTLHWADPETLLRELRELGANADPARHPGLRTPRWRERLHAALRERAVGGRIALTFEIVYGHAFKVTPRARGGDTRINVDDLAASLPSRRAWRGGAGSA